MAINEFDLMALEYDDINTKEYFEIKEISSNYILNNDVFSDYIKDKVSYVGEEILFFHRKESNGILIGFGANDENYYYIIIKDNNIIYIPIGSYIQLKNK